MESPAGGRANREESEQDSEWESSVKSVESVGGLRFDRWQNHRRTVYYPGVSARDAHRPGTPRERLP